MAREPKLLCLDLATNTGAAVGQPGETPLAYHKRFGTPDTRLGEFAHEFEKWLIDQIIVHRPTHLGYLAAILVPKRDNPTGLLKIFGLPVLAEKIAYQHGIHNVIRLNEKQAVAHFTGHGNWPEGEKKPATQRMCKMLGWKFETHDEADALMGFSLLESIKFPKARRALILSAR